MELALPGLAWRRHPALGSAFCETGRQVLFDLEDDPYELQSLAETQPALCSAMRKLTLRRLAETREPYFDVLMEHGVVPAWPPVDVSRLIRARSPGVQPRHDRVTGQSVVTWISSDEL